jgi:uncharacterized protein (TIGR00730 family)
MAEPTDQQRSRSFVLPAQDTEFLLRDELRGLRFALEYHKAEIMLREWGVRSTVIVFGSARIPSPEIVEALVQAARTDEERGRAERQRTRSRYYEEARNFGRIVSQRGGALVPRRGGRRHNVIATGGGPGIMEAANRGASEVGAPSIGFNIELPEEQAPNRYSTPELTFQFHYFAMRKMHLAMRSAAMAVFPGGFGTLDELFEILTLQQTRKARNRPVVLVGREYWQRLVDFDFLLEQGMINAEDLEFFSVVDTAEEAWAAMLQRGLMAPDGR